MARCFASATVLAPEVIFQRDPEFSQRARQAKFQGTMTLMLVANREGVPTNLHIATRSDAV